MPKLINLDRMPSRTRRPNSEELPEWQISKGAVRVLELLLRYRYLTAQLVQFCIDRQYGRGGWQARHELTRLWRHGYAERHYRPAEPRTGSNQYVYTVTPEGGQLVVPGKEWAAARRRISRRTNRPLATFDHALGVTLIQMLWDLGSQDVPLARTVPGGYWADADTLDGGVGMFEVKLQPVPDDEPSARKHKSDVRPYRIFPDTVLLLQWRDYTWPLFIELERTHKNTKREWERFRAYGELLTRQQAVAGNVFVRAGYARPRAGTVLFLGASDAHAKTLWETARDAVRSIGLRAGEGVPSMLFGSIETILRTENVSDETGRERLLQEPIDPKEFLTGKLFNNLAGKRQPLLVQY